MDLIGIDVNATRITAVSGADGMPPRPLTLAGSQGELPMALNLEKRRPDVGQSAVAICRRSPHLVCRTFLPHLGTKRLWLAGRHKLDAARATALMFDPLRPIGKGSGGVFLTLPGYLTRDQVMQVRTLAEKAKLPVLGLAGAPLALAWSARMEQPWAELAMVADIDDHALTWTAFGVSEGQVCVLGQRTLPTLGLTAWKNRLVDALADRCVRQSRRDPRDSADAEQMLFDQIERACDTCRQNQLIELAVESPHWYQNLVLRPEEFVAMTVSLARKAVLERQLLDEELTLHEPTRTVLMTATAARLPGLMDVLRDNLNNEAQITVLPANAVARASHELAVCLRRGELPRTTFDLSIPLIRGRESDADAFPGIDPMLRTGA